MEKYCVPNLLFLSPPSPLLREKLDFCRVEMAFFLGVTEEQLFQLSTKTLEGAKAALALPLAQQAALDIFLASPPTSPAEDLSTKVATLFSVTEEERKYPWRATLRLVREAFDTDRSKALFADMAKHGSLTPEVATTLQLLLFFTKAAVADIKIAVCLCDKPLFQNFTRSCIRFIDKAF